jgi:hypothetical protein
MRITLDLREDFGREASIAFEEAVSDRYPEIVKEELRTDLDAFLRVVGGLALAVVEDGASYTQESRRTDLIEGLMEVLEKFSQEKVSRKGA